MSSKLNFWRERWKMYFWGNYLIFNISGNFYSELLRFLRLISEIFRRILSAKRKVFLFILFKYIWSWYNFTVLQQSKSTFTCLIREILYLWARSGILIIFLFCLVIHSVWFAGCPCSSSFVVVIDQLFQLSHVFHHEHP